MMIGFLRRSSVACGLVVAVLAATVGATGAGAAELPAERTPTWVALGDSYAAGVGGSTVGQAPCLSEAELSASAAARRLLEQQGRSFSYTNVACSGARTSDVLTRQLSAVAGADIVTLSVGGNDAGFTDAVVGCILVASCPSGDAIDWGAIFQRVKDTYVRVRLAMPADGHLFVTSYPVFFADPASWPDGACAGDVFSAAAARRFNESAVAMGDVIWLATIVASLELEAAGHPAHIEFVDARRPVVTQTFDGRERRVAYEPLGVCSSAPQPFHTMNGFLSRAGTQLTDTFHPTDLGHGLIGLRLAPAIASVLGG
jgi:lysophospholipase L1-like esterase